MIVHAQITLEPHQLHWIAHRTGGRVRRHRSLQKRTSFQTFSHFFRHRKGRPHTVQIFEGRCCFLTPRMTHALPAAVPCRCRGEDLRCWFFSRAQP
jgi:hypothetical protein